jgi:pimeloyl-ACP methyl ester carboxylesterase
LGKGLFNVFASKLGIRNFIENFMYFDRNFVTDALIDYYYTSSHQAGAEFAPLAFFAGRLNAEIGESIGKVNQPVLLIWGNESRVSPLENGFVLLRQNPQARMVILDNAKLACNEEQAELFNQITGGFFLSPASKIEVTREGFRVMKAGQ